MRITEEELPKHNDYRRIEKFLLLPVKIGKITRWLERVVIIQRFSDEWYNFDWGDLYIKTRKDEL